MAPFYTVAPVTRYAFLLLVQVEQLTGIGGGGGRNEDDADSEFSSQQNKQY